MTEQHTQGRLTPLAHIEGKEVDHAAPHAPDRGPSVPFG